MVFYLEPLYSVGCHNGIPTNRCAQQCKGETTKHLLNGGYSRSKPAQCQIVLSGNMATSHLLLLFLFSTPASTG